MPSTASNAAIIAATDQYRGCVDELVAYIAQHLTYCPNGAWDCAGSTVSHNLNRLPHTELQIIAEIALVKLARQKGQVPHA